MGLLDDAIREHLELKRLRGADPGEVAREQREALDPVPRDGKRGEDAAGDVAVSNRDAGDVGEIEGEIVVAVDEIGEAGQHHAIQPARDTDFSNVGQETAELDMRTVLSEEQGTVEGNPARSWPVEEREEEEEKEGGADEDVLEETPDFLRDTPEQDRLWFEQQPPRDFDFDK